MSTQVKRGEFVFRLNDSTVRELAAIEADAVEIVQHLELLAVQDLQRVQMIFDRFFPLLERVRSNLIVVEVMLCPGCESPGGADTLVQ